MDVLIKEAVASAHHRSYTACQGDACIIENIQGKRVNTTQIQPSSTRKSTFSPRVISMVHPGPEIVGIGMDQQGQHDQQGPYA
ncbi:hypothetical protein Y032_0382g375 [Ancylostoma ceylanicum]|uniref:Uncharacterized protein n=1 Tax=Ancylostoma ceylanicum TaxID=53326 RepID=A0A016RU50_9BILA|nr:hypothetical protein Y032_0382g375 [Ancylostoma ceylanicum]